MAKGTVGPKTKRTKEVGKGTFPELLRTAGCPCPALARRGTLPGREAGWSQPISIQALQPLGVLGLFVPV